MPDFISNSFKFYTTKLNQLKKCREYFFYCSVMAYLILYRVESIKYAMVQCCLIFIETLKISKAFQTLSFNKDTSPTLHRRCVLCFSSQIFFHNNLSVYHCCEISLRKSHMTITDICHLTAQRFLWITSHPETEVFANINTKAFRT